MKNMFKMFKKNMNVSIVSTKMEFRSEAYLRQIKRDYDKINDKLINSTEQMIAQLSL